MNENEKKITAEDPKDALRHEYNKQILAAMLEYLDILEESVGKPVSKILEEQTTDHKNKKN